MIANRNGWKILAFGVAVCGLLGGCGIGSETEVKEPVVEQITEQAPQEITQSTERTEEIQNTQESGQEQDNTVEPAQEEQNGSTLSEAELQSYTNWIKGYDVYGFLLSDWSTPEEIKLTEVFYSGAGLSQEATQEQIDSYLQRTGQEELYTDFFVIPKQKVNDFLLEKVGLSYDELVAKGNTEMEYAYDPACDCFEMEVGDTNYMEFTVESGERTGEGDLTLHYRNNHIWGEEVGWIEAGEVKLNEESGQLLSNHITEGTILEMGE